MVKVVYGSGVQNWTNDTIEEDFEEYVLHGKGNFNISNIVRDTQDRADLAEQFDLNEFQTEGQKLIEDFNNRNVLDTVKESKNIGRALTYLEKSPIYDIVKDYTFSDITDSKKKMILYGHATGITGASGQRTGMKGEPAFGEKIPELPESDFSLEDGEWKTEATYETRDNDTIQHRISGEYIFKIETTEDKRAHLKRLGFTNVVYESKERKTTKEPKEERFRTVNKDKGSFTLTREELQNMLVSDISSEVTNEILFQKVLDFAETTHFKRLLGGRYPLTDYKIAAVIKIKRNFSQVEDEIELPYTISIGVRPIGEFDVSPFAYSRDTTSYRYNEDMQTVVDGIRKRLRRTSRAIEGVV